MSKKETSNNTAKTAVTEKMYGILKKPIITEKMTMMSEHGRIGFIVSKETTKTEVKKAIEALYKVKVESVNMVNTVGKQKRFKGHLGQRSELKKAYIKLAKGQSVDVMAGI